MTNYRKRLTFPLGLVCSLVLFTYSVNSGLYSRLDFLSTLLYNCGLLILAWFGDLEYVERESER